MAALSHSTWSYIHQVGSPSRPSILPARELLALPSSHVLVTAPPATLPQCSLTPHRPHSPVLPPSGDPNKLLARAIPSFSPQESGNVFPDVAIVGAGIIGLAVAAELLTSDPDVTVAVIDSKGPCAGATGAGQGYLWMGHRSPGTATWTLAQHSIERWHTHLLPLLREAACDVSPSGDPSIRRVTGGEGFSPSLGFIKTGSLLFTSDQSQEERLRSHVAALQGAGVEAHLLDWREVREEEPELRMAEGCHGVLVPEDSQIDAIMATQALLQVCRGHGGRYQEVMDEPVIDFIWKSGEVKGVLTSEREVHVSKAVVVTAGAWASSLMERVGKGAEEQGCGALVPSVVPRKGHLVEVPGVGREHPLRHGLMEFDYTANYAPPLPTSQPTPQGTPGGSTPLPADVAATVTMDHAGRFLIGSSRAFLGFSESVERGVVGRMMERASLFVPALREWSSAPCVQSLIDQGRVRVGLRPWSSDGKPLIGPVPCAPGVLLAVGHEGSGLTLATGTAEMVAARVLDRDCPLEASLFLPEGRLRAPLDFI